MNNSPDPVIKMDYGGRTDNLPIYLGKSEAGTSTTLRQWTVYKFAYTGTQTTDMDSRSNISWINRATPESDGKSAWTF